MLSWDVGSVDVRFLTRQPPANDDWHTFEPAQRQPHFEIASPQNLVPQSNEMPNMRVHLSAVPVLEASNEHDGVDLAGVRVCVDRAPIVVGFMRDNNWLGHPEDHFTVGEGGCYEGGLKADRELLATDALVLGMSVPPGTSVEITSIEATYYFLD